MSTTLLTFAFHYHFFFLSIHVWTLQQLNIIVRFKIWPCSWVKNDRYTESKEAWSFPKLVRYISVMTICNEGLYQGSASDYTWHQFWIRWPCPVPNDTVGSQLEFYITELNIVIQKEGKKLPNQSKRTLYLTVNEVDWLVTYEESHHVFYVVSLLTISRLFRLCEVFAHRKVIIGQFMKLYC